MMRAAWKRGEPALAVWTHLADPFALEVLASTSMDAVVIDTQHGTADPAAAVQQLRALQSVHGKATPLVRVRENNMAEIGSYLDAGYEGIICPLVNTAAQAEALLHACRYAPKGGRSWGPSRAVLATQQSLAQYHASMEAEGPLVFAMIETQEALTNLVAILSTAIDGVFVGPMDLALSLGEPCAGIKGKRCAKAVKTIVRMAKFFGKRVGIYCSGPEEASAFVSDGLDFVVCAHDKVLLANGARAAIAACRPALPRVRTTHVGSLPRPAWLLPIIKGEAEKPADYDEKLLAATVDVLRKQLDAGLDEINDGEIGRRDYVTAARQRLSGFGGSAAAPGAKDLLEATDFSEQHKGRKGLLSLTKETEVQNAACTGPIEYTPAGLEDLQSEISRVVKAAEQVGVAKDRLFFSSPSPGTLAVFFGNNFYGSHEDFVRALGRAMRTEYATIVKSGLRLQVDCPDLAMGRHTKFGEASLKDFRAAAAVHVEALTEALAGMDAERMRMHVCWGNYPGPHDADVALADIADLILKCPPRFVSVEACNPGHAHEYEVWKGRTHAKVFLPGVLDTTTPHVEHPQLVAQRLQRYAESTKGEIMACSDCGFSTAAGAVNVVESLVWKKMRSMVAGARQLSAPVGEVTVRRESQLDQDFGLLDTVIPEFHRMTTLFFGHIVSNPNAVSHCPAFFGYNMTYSGCAPGNGNAMHCHNSLEIFVLVEDTYEFSHVTDPSEATEVVPLNRFDLVAVPAAVRHAFKNVSKRTTQLLTVIPGKAAVLWDKSTVAKARAHGANCDDSGILATSSAKRQRAAAVETEYVYLGKGGLAPYVVPRGERGEWVEEHGSIAMQTLTLAPGDAWEPKPGKDWTVIVLEGAVLGAGTRPMTALDVVVNPGTLKVLAEPACILVIESQLPHDDQFFFNPPLLG